jgi:hypothetical protein
MCHLDATAENYQLIITPNYELINPVTGKPYGRDDALCMA